MKTTVIFLSIAAIAGVGLGLYMNAKSKSAAKPATILKRKDGFYPASGTAKPTSPQVQSYEVNQRNIFAGGDFRNTPLPEAVSQTFVQS